MAAAMRVLPLGRAGLRATAAARRPLHPAGAWPCALATVGARLASGSAQVSQPRPGQHQTPIVDLLWRRREEAKSKRASAVEVEASKPTSSREIVERTPEESENFIEYKFAEDEELGEQYRNAWGHIRFGRLLEDLDALAGTIAYQHCASNNPEDSDLHIVTASVDRIIYKHRPSLDHNIILTGAVTWVGRSSMEIRMKAMRIVDGIPDEDEPFLESFFTFVGRDPATGRAAQINPLKLTTPEQERLFELGKKRDEVRKEHRKKAKRSELGIKLDADGIATAKSLLAQTRTLESMPALASDNEVWLKETKQQNTLTAHPQHRNTAGRIFGGFLMRRAYELAHVTVHLFGGRMPVFLELDEVVFKAPVSVGDLLRLDACILFTSEDIDPEGRATVHVEVVATVISPETRKTVNSNVFNFTFGLAAPGDNRGRAMKAREVELRRVLPSSFEDACRIVERYEGDLRQKKESEAAGDS
eukprot:TRINITY_DN32306_c0_g1_i1.p1 TRINITY_DN32306_c0_g1~~TRINITY_DN32306_c0_g1_i1.p1  ORF type:complete len:507 (+),score=99.87 TRINITY_DN32306_c0_g1_i1:102-1523(+)